MEVLPAKFVVTVLVLSLAVPASLDAQTATSSLSGTITNSSGTALANAMVSAKNASSGQVSGTQTNAGGKFSMKNLTPAEYEVSASADGFATKTATVTLGDGAQQSVDLALSAAGQAGTAPAQAPPETLPNAPSSTKTEPSLSDLGFTPEQTQSNPQEQALLDKRTHMLKIHQRMGLITTVPLITTLALSVGAGGKSTSSADRTAHVVLGAVTGDLYFITAYYAIRAPRVPGTESKGPIRFHKAMAWIHGPGMILTPILGALAYNQKNNGEKVHGIASAHGPVAIVTAGAFGAALLSVSMKF